LAFFEQVAQLTEKYCYDDWVVERRKKDSDGNEMKATYFVPVLPLTDRTGQKMWKKAPYGLSLPYVWNSMTHYAYEFLRCNIHFADNTLQQPEGTEGYDPLFKVRYPLDAIGKGLRKVWTAGKNITIDESIDRKSVV
jgi:hypothetical protein